MKRIVSICLAVMLAVSLTSCCNDHATVNLERKNRFRTVHSESNYSVVVDEETGVMYLYVGAGYGGGLTVMVDQDGAPLVWEETR